MYVDCVYASDAFWIVFPVQYTAYFLKIEIYYNLIVLNLWWSWENTQVHILQYIHIYAADNMSIVLDIRTYINTYAENRNKNNEKCIFRGVKLAKQLLFKTIFFK